MFLWPPDLPQLARRVGHRSPPHVSGWPQLVYRELSKACLPFAAMPAAAAPHAGCLLRAACRGYRYQPRVACGALSARCSQRDACLHRAGCLALLACTGPLAVCCLPRAASRALLAPGRLPCAACHEPVAARCLHRAACRVLLATSRLPRAACPGHNERSAGRRSGCLRRAG
jgi:hypothetical protein